MDKAQVIISNAS